MGNSNPQTLRSKNQTLLESFTKYCQKNPELRFWQALQSWCGWSFIRVDDGFHEEDTFYWETNKQSWKSTQPETASVNSELTTVNSTVKEPVLVPNSVR